MRELGEEEKGESCDSFCEIAVSKVYAYCLKITTTLLHFPGPLVKVWSVNWTAIQVMIASSGSFKYWQCLDLADQTLQAAAEVYG